MINWDLILIDFTKTPVNFSPTVGPSQVGVRAVEFQDQPQELGVPPFILNFKRVSKCLKVSSGWTLLRAAKAE